MNQAVRRIIYTVAIALFVLLSPLLILYAQGFRYDLRARSYFRIGTLSIYSYPRSATVSIDGTQQPRRTPTTNLQLRPGTYRVRVQRDGFHAWEETVRITPTHHVALDATLVAQSFSARHTFDSALRAVAPSVTNGVIAVAHAQGADKYRISLFEPERGTTKQVADMTKYDDDPIFLDTSPHARFVTVRMTKGLYVLEQLTGKVVWSDVSASYDMTAWKPDGDTILYALTEGTLRSIDMFTRTSTIVASPGITSFAVNGQSVWVMQRADNASWFRSASDQASPVLSSPIILDSSVTRILDVDGGRALVTGQKATFGVDLASRTVVNLGIGPMASMAMNQSSNNNAALVSGNEVWIVSLRDLTPSFLLRLSDIRHVAWYPRRDALFIAGKSSVSLVDIEHRSATSGQLSTAWIPLQMLTDGNRSLIVAEDRAIEILTLP